MVRGAEENIFTRRLSLYLWPLQYKTYFSCIAPTTNHSLFLFHGRYTQEMHRAYDEPNAVRARI